MDQQELMAKTKEAVRNDGFTVSDNYLKGCDYPYGGGYMISCEGSQFGSLRFQGGGVIFTADAAEYYIIDAEEIPILVNRVVTAWGFLQNEWADEGGEEEVESHMLETVREEISSMNQESDGGYFLAVAEVLGRYIVRSLNIDGSLVEQTLKEFYEEITD